MVVKFSQRHVDLIFILEQAVTKMSDQSKSALIADFFVYSLDHFNQLCLQLVKWHDFSHHSSELFLILQGNALNWIIGFIVFRSKSIKRNGSSMMWDCNKVMMLADMEQVSYQFLEYLGGFI